ncbi:MAG TPA: alkaline phosphatase family protein [Verrucomicrobiae bacterium]
MKFHCRFSPVIFSGIILLGSIGLRAATGTIQDVQHVVILMQENRSFDNYYGMMNGVRGFNDRNILIQPNGRSDLFHPTTGTNYVLPFLITNYCNYGFMGYNNRTNLPFYYSLADAYTICDANFCSFPGPTFPNRIYLFTGMVDPTGSGGGPCLTDSVPTNGYSWTTYPERLQAAGISWKVYRPTGDWFGDALQWFSQYQNALPGNPLYDRGMATTNDVIAAFKADVTNGALPQVSWVIPPNLAYSEHSYYSVQLGEWFVNQIYSALTSNPAMYNSTVLIFNYDENGSYFDHVPPPIAPPGTPGEFYKGTSLGLGPRVPMMIISPWSRGGRVCSQVFDHTSVIRFLETWTGVQETNISAWRRQVCGDLTSALDFAHPDFSLPNLPATPKVSSIGTDQSAPTNQTVPIQESGVRPACPLPYQPEGNCYTDCTSNRVVFTMTNAGAASVHFVVYANAYRNDGPWQFDAPPGGSVVAPFVASSSANGNYDLTCYGPNGFQRRFAGNIPADCGRLEATSLINPASGSLTLTLANFGGAPAHFTVADGLNQANWVFNVPSGVVTNTVFAAGANNNGWYDLAVTVDTDTNFLRHLEGHIETGVFSVTETPAIVGDPLAVPTNGAPSVSTVPIWSINNAVNSYIAQNPLPPASTNPPALAITAYGTNCALIYPGWASNCVVEYKSALNAGTWTQLPAPTLSISNYDVVILPETNAGQYFRLRQ